MRHPTFQLGLLIGTVALLAPAAQGWHPAGHRHIAHAAVQALPPHLPDFFRQGQDLISHIAIDPDLHAAGAIAVSRDAERPNHYIDLELLGDRSLPATRHQFITLCAELNLDPGKVGYLPYIIEEWTQRLAMAFAEHRKWPDNPHIRTKCLVYAGLLAHYSGDLAMPLHTSVHFDGRVGQNSDGTWDKSPRTGIHAKIDALPTKLPYNEIFKEPLTPPVVTLEDNLAAIIRKELRDCHTLVDRVYELEPRLPGVEALQIADDQVRAFAIDRTRAGAAFTARLYLLAWQLSAKLTEKGVAPPTWLDRDAEAP